MVTQRLSARRGAARKGLPSSYVALTPEAGRKRFARVSPAGFRISISPLRHTLLKTAHTGFDTVDHGLEPRRRHARASRPTTGPPGAARRHPPGSVAGRGATFDLELRRAHRSSTSVVCVSTEREGRPAKPAWPTERGTTTGAPAVCAYRSTRTGRASPPAWITSGNGTTTPSALRGGAGGWEGADGGGLRLACGGHGRA